MSAELIAILAVGVGRGGLLVTLVQQMRAYQFFRDACTFTDRRRLTRPCADVLERSKVLKPGLSRVSKLLIEPWARARRPVAHAGPPVHFKVKTVAGASYTLRLDMRSGLWELTEVG